MLIMNPDAQRQQSLVLKRLQRETPHGFVTPSKKINDGDDLNFWFTSLGYRDLTVWLLQLNRSMFPTKGHDDQVQPSTLNAPPNYSEHVQGLRSLLDALSEIVAQAPPSTGPRRFGNVAFRDWFKLAEEQAPNLINSCLGQCLGTWGDGAKALNEELTAYLMGSFGSAQRLDYGTGHELSFLAFLGCLWKCGLFEEGEERAIVVGVVQLYLDLMRKLILTYTLEPAGSHGVWGLDDHSFVPYIFGSAQLGPAIDPDEPNTPVPTEGSSRSAPSPSTVVKKAAVADYKDSNMYFSAIQFIYDVKKGPFWEHSPVLYDVSGIKDGWAKINKGMLKMYAAEVLGKFPVVQHFPFGSLFRWEKDPQAVQLASSVHSQQQPPVSKDAVRPPASGVGTAAPWATRTGTGSTTMPQLQASTGVPSMRAPWAGRSVTGGPAPAPATSVSETATTAAPWALLGRQPLPSRPGNPSTSATWTSTPQPPNPMGRGGAPTAAPWAKRDERQRLP